jgi:hypothetical protein
MLGIDDVCMVDVGAGDQVAVAPCVRCGATLLTGASGVRAWCAIGADGTLVGRDEADLCPAGEGNRCATSEVAPPSRIRQTRQKMVNGT